MRVSTQQMHQRAVAQMLEQQTRLAKTQQQLASGKRFETASDDPVAAVKAMSLEREIAVTKQYQANADAVRARQEAEEAALAGVTDLLHRVRELMVQANNDTLSDTDRQSLALALDQGVEELLGLANTRDGNGEYLFSGFQSGTQPFSRDGQGQFAYQGDQGQRMLGIGPGVTVAMTDSGAEVFRFDVDPAGYRDIFSVIQGAAQALEGGADDPSARAQLHTALDRGLAELDGALEHVLLQRARVGSRLTLIESQTQTNGAFQDAATETLSNVQDLDYAEAATRLQMQMLGLEAAQQSYVSIQSLSLFNYLR